jgi:hypothetical protein
MTIAAITSAIKTRVQNVLGSEYSELNFAATVANQKRFQGSAKKFAIIPGAATEDLNGVIRLVTVNQKFNFILTDNFIGNQVNDQSKRAQAIALQDKANLIYSDLRNNPDGIGAMLVSTLTISEPKYLQDVVVINMTCIVRYTN